MRASCMKKVCRYLPYRPKRASGEASRVFCNGYLPFAFKYRTHLKVKRSTPSPAPAPPLVNEQERSCSLAYASSSTYYIHNTTNPQQWLPSGLGLGLVVAAPMLRSFLSTMIRRRRIISPSAGLPGFQAHLEYWSLCLSSRR